MAAERFSAPPPNEEHYSQEPHDFYVPESAAHKETRRIIENASRFSLKLEAVQPHHSYWRDESDSAVNSSFEVDEVSVDVGDEARERMAGMYNEVVYTEGLALNGIGGSVETQRVETEKEAKPGIRYLQTIFLGDAAIGESIKPADTPRHLQSIPAEREEVAA